ncbi:phytanoyl-CoA dioxygenase family protein (plasmid) [Streptomyces sp. NBC_01340]|uniref:phytanoyl-CoA dioxygenase family protein n=1 Tax=unclassified Streptomyces TaxID=2593676 RepID=UPI00224D2FD7|nr:MULTISPECIES: phytanoyl-CoA dioxygenase family protein [unclassified Streptomyces]MCX4461159.1 phytanoyl-CoA dioxygenase family protein [Streptomyces sp. NBC_01719]MCX4499512.1 phytanoyl-CoA dioxygenase family protein [Streptomyces sp. NBC_01728]WSI44653.1 phytanoyl-CoA dioxygenase family protein [Streptomyces sp. NBC_01340]
MPNSAPLSQDELHQFVTDGALTRRSLIPERLLQPAARLVDTWMREEYDPSRLTGYTNRTFAPDLASHPDLLGLYHRSGLHELVAQLLHPAATAPVTTAQVQIRLPDGADQPVKAMHVDGVSCPHLQPEDLNTFTLIAGIVLCGSATSDAGALHYVPGGHRRMARYFAEDWILGQPAQTPPDIAELAGTALTARPGDAVVMHHLVPHRVGRNTSPVPRVMAYFRIQHTDHHHLAQAALTDPWLEYPGLAGLTAQRADQP